MPPLPTLRRAAALTAVAALGLTGLAACGDDDDPTSSSSPEDVKAPMDEVLAELPRLVVLGNKAASEGRSGDFDAAADEAEEVHELWEEVEGTVKDTDPDIYERIETAQGLMKDGAENEDADHIEKGAGDQSDAVDEFIAANR